MIIYLIVLFLCLVLSIYEHNRNTITKLDNPDADIMKRSNIAFYSIFVVMLLIVGLRATSVGIDTENYRNAYLNLNLSHFGEIFQIKWFEEIFYYLFSYLCRLLGLSWQVYALLMAAAYFIPIMYVISKVCDNRYWSTAIFIMCGLWTYPMSTMRQAVAIGISVLAFYYESKKQNVKCLILIAVASLFHISALICLVYFLVRKIPLKRNNAFIWGIVGVLIVIFGTTVLRSLFYQLGTLFGYEYSAKAGTGGWLQEVFFILTILISFISNIDIYEKENSDYVKAIFLAAIILPIIRINPALFRIYSYFSIYQIVLVPKVLSKINPLIFRFIGTFAYLAVYMYLFFTQYMTEMTRVTPYLFFWQVQ